MVTAVHPRHCDMCETVSETSGRILHKRVGRKHRVAARRQLKFGMATPGDDVEVSAATPLQRLARAVEHVYVPGLAGLFPHDVAGVAKRVIQTFRVAVLILLARPAAPFSGYLKQTGYLK